MHNNRRWKPKIGDYFTWNGSEDVWKIIDISNKPKLYTILNVIDTDWILYNLKHAFVTKQSKVVTKMELLLYV